MAQHPDISRFLLSPEEDDDDETVMAPVAPSRPLGHYDETPITPVARTRLRRPPRDTPTAVVRLPTAVPRKPRPTGEVRGPTLPVVSFLSGFWAIAGFIVGAWWASS